MSALKYTTDYNEEMPLFKLIPAQDQKIVPMAQPYHLAGNENKSQEFYASLASFTNRVLFLFKELNAFDFFVKKTPQNQSPVKTREEYLVEFLLLGNLWNLYGAKATKIKGYEYSILRKLYQWRKTKPKHKKSWDSIRGFLAGVFLDKSSSRKLDFTLENFEKLLLWLGATCEYNEEVRRFAVWKNFMAENRGMGILLLREASEMAELFGQEAQKHLGKYTSGVNAFKYQNLKEYKFREDYFFCGRDRSEYHLNMFGAEILNRRLQEGFEKAKNKVVLLPTCMCKPKGTLCQAKTENGNRICGKCNFECQAYQITVSNQQKGVQTVLMPHSSNFSAFLEKWKNQSETALVGVACVLNLLTGGYEMQNLNIPSQCVFLNHSGCKGHWHTCKSPTSIDTVQLNKILNC